MADFNCCRSNDLVKTDKKEENSGKPKRPLSAYNFFFQHERNRIIQETPERTEGKPRRSHGKIGFSSLARTVATKWKNIDPSLRDYFEDLAAEEKARYKKEKAKWKKLEASRKANAPISTSDDSNKKSKCLSSTCSTLLPPSAYPGVALSQMLFRAQLPQQVKPSSSAARETTAEPIPMLQPSVNGLQNQTDTDRRGATISRNISLLEEALELAGEEDAFSLGTTQSNLSLDQLQTYRMYDVSELATKLDDECLDILSDFLVKK